MSNPFSRDAHPDTDVDPARCVVCGQERHTAATLKACLKTLRTKEAPECDGLRGFQTKSQGSDAREAA